MNEGTFGTVPVFEDSVAGSTDDLATAVGPVEAGVLLNELVVGTAPALEAEPESAEEAGLVPESTVTDRLSLLCCSLPTLVAEERLGSFPTLAELALST